MRTILIDDELDSLESLQAELKIYCPELEVTAACNSAREGLEAIRTQAPELVFLDIEMPYMNGFELLESLDEIDFDVIFVTAYDEFAVRAFEFNVMDYLLKPVMKSKLLSAVSKVKSRRSPQLDQNQLKALISNIHVQSTQKMDSIALPIAEGFEFVHVNEIAYVRAESNYSWVFLTNGAKYLLAKTLKQVCGMLRFPQFFRAHQSYYVNMNAVKQYFRGQGGYLVMKDGEHIPVSRANKKALMRYLSGEDV